MGKYNDFLQAEFTPPLKWILNKTLSYDCDQLTEEDIQILREIDANCTSKGKISARAGFETNLASVPRSLWSILSPWDIARASVIHDYLYYACQRYFETPGSNLEKWNRARKIADKVFLYAMQDSEPQVNKFKILSAYYAVRWFGAKFAKSSMLSKEENKDGA